MYAPRMHESGRDGLKEMLKRYAEAGASLSKLTRADLEELARETLRGGGSGRDRVEDLFDEVRTRSRRGVEQLADLVRAEVRREFESRAAKRRDELGEFLERALALVGEYFGPGRYANRGDRDATSRPASAAGDGVAPPEPAVTTPATAAATKAARATPARKTPAAKAPAKKPAAAKAPAKRPAAAKAPAKKAAGRTAPSRRSTPDAG